MNVDIPELVSMDDYDARQAKLESSMRWLLTKASTGAVPSEYRDAFFSLGLSSSLGPRLASSEIYWTAAAAMFPEVKGQSPQGHTPLIQFLTRQGVYLSDVNGAEVNEQLLQRTSPLHLMAHITFLDGLMTAYINSVLTPEKVVPAVRKFATFSASSELPTSTEDAALFWVNKACTALCQQLRTVNPSSSCPEALALSDVKDVNDGRCIAAVVSFYCPQELPVSAVELGESLAIADSLYNLQLVYNFVRDHLPSSLLALTVMDLFYTPETLQLNLLAFFADLFHCLELEKAACARDTGQPLTLAPIDLEPQKTQEKPQPSRVIIPQISDPTKRSFHQSVSVNRPQSSGVNIRQPLLPRRQSDSRPVDELRVSQPPPKEAWAQNNNQSKGLVSDSQSSGTSLLSNVMIDTSMSLNALDSSIQLSDSDLLSRQGTPRDLTSSGSSQEIPNSERQGNAGEPTQPHLSGELSSSSNLPSDPLIPAQLRPAKEKTNNHSKKCEYSEHGDRRKHTATTPDENNCERPEARGETSNGSSSSSTPSDGYKTPSLESAEIQGAEINDKGNVFQFEVSPSVSANDEASSSVQSGNLDRNRVGGQSYVVRGRPERIEDALAAGIPVVSGDGKKEFSRGSVVEYGSSNDGSDQELHKLRADYKEKEVKGGSENQGYFLSVGANDAPPFTSSKPPLDKRIAFDLNRPVERLADNSSKTSFAQIKKQKDAEEGTKALPERRTPPEGVLGNMPKGIPLLARPRKKATFGALPNQTTWIQESAQRVPEQSVNRAAEDTVNPMPSELIGLRLKLEENRRQIENRKRLAERQWTQQRQQMGKEAFIQVITKNKTGSDSVGEEKSSAADEDKLGRKTPDGSTRQNHQMALSLDGQLAKAKRPEKIESPVRAKQHEAMDGVPANERQAGNQLSNSHGKTNGAVMDDLVATQPKARQIKSPSQVSKELFAEKSNVEVKDAAVVGKPGPSKADRGDAVKYDASLNKINTSLSELHGEIKRLSVQQDQINNLVRSDISQGGRISSTVSQVHPPPTVQGRQTPQNSQMPHGATTPTTDEFYIPMFGSAREQLPVGLRSSPLPSVLPPGVQSIFQNEATLHQSRPTAVPYSVPSYPPLATSYPQHYHPNPSLPLPISHYQQPYATPPQVSLPTDQMYSPAEAGHHYAQLGNQYHPSSGMYPMVPGMYPVPTSFHNQYQSPVPHQQYPHLQNLSTLVPHPDFAAGFSPHGMPFNNFSSPHPSFPSQPPMPPTSFYSPVWFGSDPALAAPHSVTQSLDASNPEQTNSALQIRGISAAAVGQEPDTSRGIVPEMQTGPQAYPSSPPPPQSPIDVEGVKEPPHGGGGFFVNLGDSPQPSRQKPSIKDRTPKPRAGNEPMTLTNPVLTGAVPESQDAVLPAPADAKTEVATVSEGTAGSAMDSEAAGSTENSPVVFVIGRSTETEDDWLEMEKRKQRLCDLQLKRLEEQEMRREKLQREQEQMRESQRQKQEMTEQKRAEDKARRDAIYQQYLQKKMETEVSEELIQKPLPPVIRRQRSARAARPKSQPALTAEITAAVRVVSGHGHSSQDNLVLGGGLCKSPASDLSQSSDKVNSLGSRGEQTPGEVPLAFGGLTHRRPPTPDHAARLAQPASDGSESSGSQIPDNYAGPKLFVKPSQKSNRHIIINAISHCCLAGSVNKDVKNKVLEEIAKSDSYHFIILFRDAGMQYRGLYTYNPDQSEVVRIHGVGPRLLTDKVMEKFFKYNSGGKTFSEVTSTKHLTATIDAITVLSTVWPKTRPVGPTKKPV